MDSTTIRVGSAVRVTWPSTLAPVFHARYDGRVGVILEERGKMRTPQHGEEQLWLVDIDGHEIHSVLVERHLEVLRPDLEQFIHSTRYPLTASDVVHDHLNAQRY